MKKTLLHIVLCTLVFFMAHSGFAISYTIPDEHFRDFLMQHYPEIFIDDVNIETDSVVDITDTINCSGLQINDLNGIQYFTNIRGIIAHHNGMTHMPVIDNHANITTIDLSHNNLQHIPTILNTPELIELDLSYNLISEFHGMELENLQTLNLSHNDLELFANGINLPSIESLNLRYNELVDVSNVWGITNLSHLDIGANHVTSLNGIATLTKLQILIADSNEIAQLDELPYDELSHLDLSYNTLTGLPSFPASTVLEKIYLSHNQLSTLNKLSEASALTHLDIKHNNLTSLEREELPSSLKTLLAQYNVIRFVDFPEELPQLDTLNLSHNEIYEISPIKGLQQVHYIDLSHNDMTKAPEITFAETSALHIDMSSNKLEDISDVNLHEGITSFILKSNSLQISDMLPLVQFDALKVSSDTPIDEHPYVPQDSAGVVTLKSVRIGEVITLLPEETEGSSQYKWYQDGGHLETSEKLDVPVTDSSKAGLYTYHVTNEAIPGLEVIYKGYSLTVSDCFPIQSPPFEVSERHCNENGSVEVFPEEQKNEAVILNDILLVSKWSKDTIQGQNNVYKDLNEADYDLVVHYNNVCKEYFKNIVYVPDNNDCKDLIFTPNGDGQHDEYFIKESGNAKIYNKNGQFIKELQTPAAWDGTDASGKIVDDGYYVIIIDERKQIKITILK